MSTPVTVSKYLACAEFDTGTGVCTTEVWVDMPGILPALTIEEGAGFAIMVGILWICIAAFAPVQEAIRDN